MDAITQLRLLAQLETLREAQIWHGEMLRKRSADPLLPGVI